VSGEGALRGMEGEVVQEGGAAFSWGLFVSCLRLSSLLPPPPSPPAQRPSPSRLISCPRSPPRSEGGLSPRTSKVPGRRG